MNRRMVFYTVGQILKILAFLFIVPMATSIIYGETHTLLSFLICSVISFLCGLLFTVVSKPYTKTIYAREGFAIVALSWVLMSAFGALPFVVSGDIKNFFDAFFETASGFSTTGASILRDVTVLTKGCLMWRSFTHWIGGMGVLVLIVALFPNVSERSIHILRAEMAGPVIGKLVPRAKDTAKILYIIYFFLTGLEIIFLRVGGMSMFDSIVLSFGTAGTGGFALTGESIGAYSAYSQWVIAVFMIVFGVNFNIYFILLRRKIKAALSNFELWCYLGIMAGSSILITVNVLRLQVFSNISDAIRNAVFQVASIVTTTGYATTDFNLWPTFSKSIIFVLMFVGGCAGSTAGGLKVARVVILFKMIGREIKRLLHPRSVCIIKSDGKQVEEPVVNTVGVYFALYMVLILFIFLILSIDPVSYDVETNLSASVSCFNNVGPGLGSVGPYSSYADYSCISKFVLSIAMLLGRLEIFPLLLAFHPATWIRK